MLMLATVLLAAASYWLFVRPISLAQKFIDKVAAKEYRQAEQLCINSKPSFLVEQAEDWDNCEVEVKLVPRSWSDVLHFRQSITFAALRREPIKGTNTYVTIRGDLIAGPMSIEPPRLYPTIVKH